MRSELNECLFDQIPPLADLERWLVQLSLVGPQQVWNLPNCRQAQKPFILELVASVRQHLIQQLDDNWSNILKGQKQWLSQATPENLQQYFFLKFVEIVKTLLTTLPLPMEGHTEPRLRPATSAVGCRLKLPRTLQSVVVSHTT